MDSGDLPVATCPACGAAESIPFHVQEGIPTNSCLLVDSREAALGFPRGDLELVFCTACGFIYNARFVPENAEYSGRYEETQGFSGQFVDFAGALAERWVDDYQLKGKTVLEIGCGKGEFLSMMVDAGIARGIGIDPGVDVSRIESAALERCLWITDFFDDDLVRNLGSELGADAIVCRHTLEHIQKVGDFLDSIRRFIGERLETVVLFELPDTQRVLDEVAFWDVYYEHCSYFSRGSLGRLFEKHGFDILDIRLAYDDQYLLLEARPASSKPNAVGGAVDDIGDLRTGVQHFRQGYSEIVERWRSRLDSIVSSGEKAVIWGAGSKGVSFLSVVEDRVVAAVDINPYKHGKFMAGTGHRIIAPSELTEIDPRLVIAMNPVYLGEIQTELDELGVAGELVAL